MSSAVSCNKFYGCTSFFLSPLLLHADLKLRLTHLPHWVVNCDESKTLSGFTNVIVSIKYAKEKYKGEEEKE